LIRRGEAFIANGDIATARLVLQRAAEAGDARAAQNRYGARMPDYSLSNKDPVRVLRHDLDGIAAVGLETIISV
jgi:hypothetical protein